MANAAVQLELLNCQMMLSWIMTIEILIIPITAIHDNGNCNLIIPRKSLLLLLLLLLLTLKLI